MKPLSRAELRGTQPVYLVELTIAGRIFRLARRTVHLVSDDGDAYLYRGTLNAIDYIDEIGMLTTSPPRRSLSVEAYLNEDVGQYVAWGHTLEGGEGRLYVWVEGRSWDERVLLLRGKVRDVEYRGAGYSMTCTIEDEPAREGILWPPATAVIDGQAWGDGPDDDAIGKPYPLPFGRPGVYTEIDGTETLQTGSPAYLVDKLGTATPAYALLIADGAVVATTVRIRDSVAGASYSSKAVTIGRDGRGRVVSLVGLTSGQAASGSGYSVVWTGDGGITSEGYAAFDQRGMGDVLAWMLRRSGRLVDWGSVSAVVDELNQYAVGGFADQRIDTYEWAVDNMLSILPIWMGGGPDGVRIGVLRFAEGAHTAAFHFREGRDGSVASDPITEADIANELTMSFGYAYEANDHRRQVRTATAQGEAGIDVPSWYAAVSQQRHGVVEDQIDSELTGDPTTASLLLLKMLRFRGLARTAYEYHAKPEWVAVPAGTRGLVTSSSQGLDARPCILQAVRHGQSSAVLRFVVIEDPAIQ